MSTLSRAANYGAAAILAILAIMAFVKGMRLSNPTAKTFFDWILPWPPSRMYPFSEWSRGMRLKRAASISALHMIAIYLFVIAVIVAGSAAEGFPADIFSLLICFIPLGLIQFAWTTLQIYMNSTVPRSLRAIETNPHALNIQISMDKPWQRFLLDERFVLSVGFTGLGATIAVLITAVFNIYSAESSLFIFWGIVGGLIGLPTGFATGLYLRKKWQK